MEAQVDAPALSAGAPLILTLQLDESSQARFDQLRQEHYPAELNRISAHLTLFHKLPQDDDVIAAVAAEAELASRFPVRVIGLRSLGRGVAFSLESEQLSGLHRRLAGVFAHHLSAQDRQKFWPHVVVQNKSTGDKARELKAKLHAAFSPFTVEALGLELWLYLGGPWELKHRFRFR